MAKVEFDSEDEFVEVIDEVFTMMNTDPEMGPKLRDADVPQRFEFTDLDLVVNIRAAEHGEDGNLHWVWSDEVDWEPKVKMAMSSETANKYFQGKENVAVALARRRIKSGGDVMAALSLIPITSRSTPAIASTSSASTRISSSDHERAIDRGGIDR